ncbi:hypothetical protein FF100_22090 [Methylobacterium terricola]|uniref:Scaffolding protein n=1 Tax=Methylobacterium terricola TaxID=2583531 RepID=A0A5C4LDP7_9HYPH|nr:hypothetical protein [Methylobacterium terricola]TNC10844.1 hypothetical protein FF100_22090 [Methylobacterium terricola]
MSEQANEPFDAVAAFESILSDPNGAADDREELETDAETDEVEAQEDPEDDASDESDAEGDSDTDEAGDGEDLDEEVLVTVKIDGKTEKVALKELRNGYQRNAVFSQKTMALAEERKAFHAEQEAIRQERAQYAYLLDALNRQVSTATAQEPTPEQWEYLKQTNPQGYAIAKLEFNELRDKQAAIHTEQQRLAYEAQAQQAAEFQATVAQERDLLLQKHPEFRNEKVWQKARKELREFGRDVMGFSEEELNYAADHRAVSALYVAMKAHRAANAKAEPVKSEAKRVPVGSVAATPRKPNAFESANKRLKSSGSLSDAAEALRHLI